MTPLSTASHRSKKPLRRLVAILATATLALPGIVRAQVDPGHALMADALTDDARSRARSVPGELGAKEAQVLLQVALRLNPDSADAARYLSVAATVTGNHDLARDSLKTLIRDDPDNLVAQVDFIDSLAVGRTVDEQLKLYQNTLDRDTLDPQVRSEMAVRIGRLLIKRGESDEAFKMFQQALTLNDVNMGAWQEICLYENKSNAPPQSRLLGYINLLLTNPYQPDALVGGARVLESCGAHGLAASWLIAALEQYDQSGRPGAPEVFLELGYELVIENRLTEAEPLIGNLLKIPNGPTVMPMIAAVMGKAGHPIPMPAATQPSSAPASQPGTDADSDPLLTLMRQRATAAIAADPKSSNALVDAIWTEVYFAPPSAAANPDVDKNLEALKAIIGAQSPMYQRLYGWSLLAQGKTAEAKGALEGVGAKDPFALLGLARVAEQDKDTPTVESNLQQIWAGNPTGLLAVLTATEARRVGIKLTDTPEAQGIRDVAKGYPDSALQMQRHPRDLVLVQPKLAKVRYEVGEPINLDVAVFNATDRPLYAGPGGGASPRLFLGGNLGGVTPTPLGIFAVENNPRIYRLEPHGSQTISMRVDQGLVRDLLYTNPSRLFSLNLMIVTNAREVEGGVSPGLGGQRVDAKSFDRSGFSLGGAEGITRMVHELPSMPTDRQMVIGSVLQAIVYNLPEDTADAAGQKGHSWGEARKATIAALLNQLQSGDPAVQGWMLRYAPHKDLPEPISDQLDKMDASVDPLVRMVWYTRALLSAGNNTDARQKVAPILQAKAAAEKDPLAKQWAELLSQEAMMKVAEADAGTK